MKTWSGRQNTSRQDPYVMQEFTLAHDLGRASFWDLLRPVLIIYSILSQFPNFHQFSIFLHNDVIMQQWFQLHATSSSMPCHVTYIPYHHSCQVMSSYLPYHHPYWVCPAIVSLVIPLSLLNSFDINDDPCNGSFFFYWFHHTTMSIGYSFVIRELLWHEWHLYSQ